MENNVERSRMVTRMEVESLQAYLLIPADKALEPAVQAYVSREREINFFLARAELMVDLDRRTDAAVLIRQAVALAVPTSTALWLQLNVAYNGKDYAAIEVDAQRFSAAFPENLQAKNLYGWFLATCREAKHRDGKKALKLSMEVCQASDYKVAEFLSTLAAAYAENRDFDRAIQTIDTAIGIAKDQTVSGTVDQWLIQELERERQAYVAKQPYREAEEPVIPEVLQRLRQVMRQVEVLKGSGLGWNGASLEARRFWDDFELANRDEPEAMLDFCQEMVKRKVTIQQLFQGIKEMPGVDIGTVLDKISSS